MKTFATLFSGGEGVGVGLTAAGLSHLWGIEYAPAIAAVAQANGFDVTVADVRAVDYAAMPRADWLHASPSCTRASVANANATEAQEDIEAAQAVCRALAAQEPEVFTLENVWQYRTFAAFRLICDQLGRMGYFWTYTT
jgi:site-specific DNA-cytosine methylase